MSVVPLEVPLSMLIHLSAPLVTVTKKSPVPIGDRTEIPPGEMRGWTFFSGWGGVPLWGSLVSLKSRALALMEMVPHDAQAFFTHKEYARTTSQVTVYQQPQDNQHHHFPSQISNLFSRCPNQSFWTGLTWGVSSWIKSNGSSAALHMCAKIQEANSCIWVGIFPGLNSGDISPPPTPVFGLGSPQASSIHRIVGAASCWPALISPSSKADLRTVSLPSWNKSFYSFGTVGGAQPLKDREKEIWQYYPFYKANIKQAKNKYQTKLQERRWWHSGIQSIQKAHTYREILA